MTRLWKKKRTSHINNEQGLFVWV